MGFSNMPGAQTLLSSGAFHRSFRASLEPSTVCPCCVMSTGTARWGCVIQQEAALRTQQKTQASANSSVCSAWKTRGSCLACKGPLKYKSAVTVTYFEFVLFPSPTLVQWILSHILQHQGKHSTSGWWARSTWNHLHEASSCFCHENWSCFGGWSTLDSLKNAEEQNSGWSAGNCEGVNCCWMSTKRNMFPRRWRLGRRDSSLSMLPLVLLQFTAWHYNR